MMIRALFLIATAALLGAAWWLLSPGDWAHHGATIEPSNLTLLPGERHVVRLINNEADVVALGFRLRFDESVIALEASRPEQENILTGGNAIHLPIHRKPGLLEVPGSAVIGGRVFEPSQPVHRFTVRGVRPGTTTLTVEDLTIVDLGDEQRRVSVQPSSITVRAP